jgi:hypothetical protein
MHQLLEECGGGMVFFTLSKNRHWPFVGIRTSSS